MNILEWYFRIINLNNIETISRAVKDNFVPFGSQLNPLPSNNRPSSLRIQPGIQQQQPFAPTLQQQLSHFQQLPQTPQFVQQGLQFSQQPGLPQLAPQPGFASTLQGLPVPQFPQIPQLAQVPQATLQQIPQVGASFVPQPVQVQQSLQFAQPPIRQFAQPPVQQFGFPAAVQRRQFSANKNTPASSGHIQNRNYVSIKIRQ